MGGMAPMGQQLQAMSLGTLVNAGARGDKIAVPVSNYSVFAQFKHVEGVPAGNGPGYSVSKLQILDLLIDRLIKLKQNNAVSNVPKDPQELSGKAVDALIEDLAGKLKTAVSIPANPADASLGSGFGMNVSQNGALVSLLA